MNYTLLDNDLLVNVFEYFFLLFCFMFLMLIVTKVVKKIMFIFRGG